MKRLVDWIDSPTAYATLAVLGFGIFIGLLALAFSGGV